MKKILFLITLLLFPLAVFADGTDKYYIEANILSNGDMQVRELKILEGTFNGHETSLRYKNSKLYHFTGIKMDFDGSDIYNASAIENVKIYGVKISDNPNFDIINSQFKTEFSKVSSANLGDYGVYTKEDNNYRIYLPSYNNEASLITYTLKDVVVIHNDVAEVAWDFIGSDYRESINNLEIIINLPGESEELRVFSHGPLYGTNNIVNKKQVSAEWTSLDAYKAVDVRVVFDKDLVSLGTKKSNVDGLSNILEVEKFRADKANYIRENGQCYLNCDFDNNGTCDLNCDTNSDGVCDLNCDTNNDYKCDINCDLNGDGKCDSRCYSNYLKVGSYLSIALMIFIGIYYYLKYDKEYRKTFTSKYYREFIDDYNVEVIDYLMKKTITPNAMSAAILNLVYKKYIKVTKVMNKKNKPELIFTKINVSPDKAESELMGFLFDDVGDGLEFSDKKLQEYAKNKNSYDYFLKSYSKWKNITIETGKELKFWQSNKQKAIFSLIIIASGAVIFGLTALANGLGNQSLMAITFILHFILLIYVLSSQKRTIRGNEDYQKWNAFKNFLNDFGSFETKELPEIILWERYLVYATIFGIADKVSKTMNVKIKEFNDVNNYAPSFTDYVIYNNMINRSIVNSVAAARSTAAAVRAASASSSSGGFGGGSSFGGGGFGGGGSGGGRF